MGFISPQSYWITLYFAFNLVLTLYNKGVLMHFPFPYSLTALHALFGSVGGFLLMHYGTYIPAQLSFNDHVSLALFSVLYAVNIAVSNVSLHLVTVPVSILFQCTAVFWSCVNCSFIKWCEPSHLYSLQRSPWFCFALIWTIGNVSLSFPSFLE